MASAKMEFPDLDLQGIIEKLEYRWKGMTMQEKNPYRSRYREDIQSFKAYSQLQHNLLKKQQPELSDQQIKAQLKSNW